MRQDISAPNPDRPYSYRDDPAVPPFPDEKPIIVFDGLCAFCSAWVGFVLRHDKRAHYRLLAAQSDLGRALYIHYGLDPVDYETNLLVSGGRLFVKSEGSIRMAEGLGFPWRLAGLVRVLPLPLRDRLYEWVARNRFRWFGRRDECYMPRPGDRARFLA